MTYTILIVAENRPGVLYRITGLFTKRKINIEHMTAFETKKQGVSQISITAEIDDQVVDTLTKQIDKVVEVLHVKYHGVHR